MSESVFEITRKHGKEMHILGMKHALEMAKVFQSIELDPDGLVALIEHLETKIAKEEAENV